MENNSNSALKINQVISTFTVLIVLGTNVQLFSMYQGKTKVTQNNEQEKVQQVATSYERNKKVTTRSEINRTSREVKPAQASIRYKTIEEIKISTNMDLSIRCGISKEDFNKLMSKLKVDTSGFFKRNSNIIYDLCEKYELNEIFFCGLIAAESGWNISSNHRKANNYISMMSKGKLIKYSSEAEGLEAAAKLLHNRYLTPGGSCYSGKTLSGVQKRFCPNSSTWVGLVFGCMKQVIK